MTVHGNLGVTEAVLNNVHHAVEINQLLSCGSVPWNPAPSRQRYYGVRRFSGALLVDYVREWKRVEMIDNSAAAPCPHFLEDLL